MMRPWVLTTGIVLCFSYHHSIASQDSIGPNGINSAGLGLTGAGITIGQVEPFRPGKFGFDDSANCCNQFVEPTDVFVLNQSGTSIKNSNIDAHAMYVAGVMISEQTSVPTGSSASPPVGVAQQAVLLSDAFNDFEQNAAVAAQTLAASGSNMRAINFSFGLDPEGSEQLNGGTLLSLYLDWSASNYDILNVIAGNAALATGTPTDSYNGLVVGALRKADGENVFRKYGTTNNDEVSSGNRTFIDLLAPGEGLDLAGPNQTLAPLAASSGTSFAAPHVTGTVALLQQYVAAQIDNVGGARWTVAAKHHQVMKAALMNSADALQGVLGQQKTILKRNSSLTWTNSVASGRNNDTVSLDEDMGTGALNASRAMQQLSPGQYGPGSVPLIGWDYNNVNVNTTTNKYVFNQTIQANDYLAITLVWDRQVVLQANSAPFDQYKPGDELIDNGFSNLDFYIVPAGYTLPNGATVPPNPIASSTTMQFNVEHIFAPISTAQNVELWVYLNDQSPFASQDYGLAWWIGSATNPHASSGDFNGDGIVNAADYDVWRSDFGTNNAAADANGDGKVDTADYVVWRDHLGQSVGSGVAAVPEPTFAVYLTLVVAFVFQIRRRSN